MFFPSFKYGRVLDVEPSPGCSLVLLVLFTLFFDVSLPKFFHCDYLSLGLIKYTCLLVKQHIRMKQEILLAEDLFTFDTSSNTWAQITPTGGPPPGRRAHAALTDGAGQMWVVGGYYSGATQARP